MREVSAIKRSLLVDQSLPASLSSAFEQRGIRAKHISEVFNKNVSKEAINNYAENNKMVILTRDKKAKYNDEIFFRGDLDDVASRLGYSSAKSGQVQKFDAIDKLRKPMRAIKVI